APIHSSLNQRTRLLAFTMCLMYLPSVSGCCPGALTTTSPQGISCFSWPRSSTSSRWHHQRCYVLHSGRGAQ
ncbi:hypothetical protein JOB18_024369, partial [Solea senegalensis]